MSNQTELRVSIRKTSNGKHAPKRFSIQLKEQKRCQNEENVTNLKIKSKISKSLPFKWVYSGWNNECVFSAALFTTSLFFIVSFILYFLS